MRAISLQEDDEIAMLRSYFEDANAVIMLERAIEQADKRELALLLADVIRADKRTRARRILRELERRQTATIDQWLVNFDASQSVSRQVIQLQAALNSDTIVAAEDRRERRKRAILHSIERFM